MLPGFGPGWTRWTRWTLPMELLDSRRSPPMTAPAPGHFYHPNIDRGRGVGRWVSYIQMGRISGRFLKSMLLLFFFSGGFLLYLHFFKPPAEFGIRSHDFWIPDHRIENSTAGLGNLKMGFA